MKTRKLRDIEVSEIGMGCMAFSHGYGQIPEKDYSIEAIRKAYDYGCTFFDTADMYGAALYYPGHNEEIVGEAVEPFRDKVVLATKFHFNDGAPQTEEEIESYIRSHLEKSMKNLRTNYIDLYYLHRVNEDVSLETTAKVMGKLIDEGLIRGWGLSQVDTSTLKMANDVTPVSAVQNLYNMLERDCEKDLLPYCLQNNIGLVPFSPIASGFLSGKIKADTKFEKKDDVRNFVPQLKKENIEANQPVIDLLQKFASEKKATTAQISLAWMLKKYPNVVPIPGSRHIDHIMENLKASEVELSDEEFNQLDGELDKIPVHGHRGNVEYEKNDMRSWDRK